MSDTYLHVPGFHPSIDDPIFFQQRVDDPSVLPSLHKHLWGRVASLGYFTLQVEKKLYLKRRIKAPDTLSSLSSEPDSQGIEELGVDFGGEPLLLNGEGRSLMLEWSKPTVVALAKVMEHCQKEHAELFCKLPVSSSASSLSTSSSFFSTSSSEGEGSQNEREGLPLPVMCLQFQLIDVNMFLYGLTPGWCN